MGKPMDIQEAFDELTKHLFEMRQAIVFLGTNLASRLVAQGLAEKDEMVDRLRIMAEEAGRQCAKLGNEAARANPTLLDIAETLEANSEPLKVIEGGKGDDGPGAD